MGASISPVGLLVLCCHPPVEIMWEYLFTIIHDLLCVECDVAVIGMAVKGASWLFQRLGIFKSIAPSMCSYPCSRAQPNLLIIPLSNGVNGHISPRDQREGGRLWCKVVVEIQMYASVYGWRLHNRYWLRQSTSHQGKYTIHLKIYQVSLLGKGKFHEKMTLDNILGLIARLLTCFILLKKKGNWLICWFVQEIVWT